MDFVNDCLVSLQGSSSGFSMSIGGDSLSSSLCNL